MSCDPKTLLLQCMVFFFSLASSLPFSSPSSSTTLIYFPSLIACLTWTPCCKPSTSAGEREWEHGEEALVLCVCGFFFKSERERDRWVSSPLKASTNFSESIYIGASDEREKGGALSRNQSGHNKSSLNNFTYKSLFTITHLPSLYYYYTHSFTFT